MALTDLPEPIQEHIRTLAANFQKSQDEDFVEVLATVWSKKAQLFLDQTKNVDMQVVDHLDMDEHRGLLLLTYSGSLLSVAPLYAGAKGRWMEYSSIKLRTDVPDIVFENDGNLGSPAQQGHIVKIQGKRLRQTSNLYYIAVCDHKVPLEEQEKRVRESTIFLTNGFMKYNRTLSMDKGSVPDQFTMKSMTRYIAKKHGMTGTEAKLLLEDFLTLVETGMLLGEAVPMGKIGKLTLKKREAQKARVIKHPTTGEEITVEAKPEMAVPKISFSSYLKARAAALDFEE